MSISTLLRWYARKGPLRAFRESAYRKFCRRHVGASLTADLEGGLRMHTVIGDSVDDQIYVKGVYEAQVTAIVRRLAPGLGVFVDVGCNIGYLSCVAGHANPEAHIVAIDPNPKMIERTRANLALNGIKRGTLLNVGIGASARTMTLYVPRDRHSLSSLAYQPDRGVKSGIDALDVQVTRLFDAVPAELRSGRRLVLKVDAEGFEHEVFSGITTAESAALDFVIFELSARNLARAGVEPRRMFEIPWFTAFTAYICTDAGTLVPLAVGGIDEHTEANVVMVRHGCDAVLADLVVSGDARSGA